MARLHEYQSKAVLQRNGFSIPRGQVARTPDEAAAAAKTLGPVLLKIQAWTTGRAAIGGIAFADTPEQARDHAARLLKIRVGNFPVTELLIEEKLSFARELFLSLSIDDKARAPIILLSLHGGSGIEERAAEVHKFVCDVHTGPSDSEIRTALKSSDLAPAAQDQIIAAVKAVFTTAKSVEARSVEINPLVITKDGRLIAADARITIDDYAVFRHPELGIDIARELDHPPTTLERIAYQIEQDDHRGTFFFAEMNSAPVVQASGLSSKGLIGFHGAGGGGSMMSMDAITNEGFTIANFCDTSGNPSPAKVYRAARIILMQRGLIGYFGSGSGVANQEQFWSAYGLAKAFWELNLDIPAVIRLGGNTEDRAVEILHAACKELPAKVDCYKKTDPPAKIAARFAELVTRAADPRATDLDGSGAKSVRPATTTHTWQPRAPQRPSFVGSGAQFPVKGGRVWIDPVAWKKNAPAIISRASGLLRDDNGKPALTVTPSEFLTKDSDMIACEVECRIAGIEGLFVELDIPALPN